MREIVGSSEIYRRSARRNAAKHLRVGQFELIADPIKRAANPLSTHQKDSEEVSHAT